MKKVFYNPIGASKEPLLKKVRSLIKQGNALNFLYVVPTHGMLQKIKKELLKDTGIRGLIPGSITTFDYIVTEVLDTAGIHITEMDDFTRFRCVEEAVRVLREQGKLRVLQKVSMFSGFISALMFMIGEIKRSGLTLKPC
jgi:ATP-dependent helicase/DNAse subunit B